jgi:hypothetical protein
MYEKTKTEGGKKNMPNSTHWASVGAKIKPTSI